MEKLKAFFDKYIFNFKGIMVSSLILSAIMFILIFLQPTITNYMIKFYEHVPKINKKEEIKVRNSAPQKVIPKSTKNIENTILIARIDSLEKKISQIETEGNEPDLSAYRGTFGDMYGSLNSLFSGIGIVGLIVTILLQILIHKREIERDKEKIKQEILETHTEKLAYLSSILNLCLEIGNSNSLRVQDFIEKVSDTPFLYQSQSNFSKEIDLSRIQNILENLNEEEYFYVYIKNISPELSISECSANVHALFYSLYAVVSEINFLKTIAFKSKPQVEILADEVIKQLLSAIKDKEGEIHSLYTCGYLEWCFSNRKVIDLSNFYNFCVDETKNKLNQFNIEDSTFSLKFLDERISITNKFEKIEDLIIYELAELEAWRNKINSTIRILQNEKDKINSFLKI